MLLKKQKHTHMGDFTETKEAIEGYILKLVACTFSVITILGILGTIIVVNIKEYIINHWIISGLVGLVIFIFIVFFARRAYVLSKFSDEIQKVKNQDELTKLKEKFKFYKKIPFPFYRIN
jgi:phosphate/sulfate permease